MMGVLRRLLPQLPTLRSQVLVDCGCSSVVEHLLAKERVESSNLFIRLHSVFFGGKPPTAAARARR